MTGLEAMSNGIQFVINEDVSLVKWGKKRLPQLNKIWNFYSGKTGIGRFVQTAFLFYGGVTTMILTAFAIHFNVFDGTYGRTLVGNLAWIGFGQIPGGALLYWVYQGLAVILLAIASMTAFQDAQATEWRDVAIGEIPEAIIYRDKRGTFTRSVTITFGLAIIIMLLVKGNLSVAAPFYGVGVFMPITVMGLAIRQHILQTTTGQDSSLGFAGRTLCCHPVSFCVGLPDCWQVARRRLGEVDFLRCTVPFSAPDHYFTAWIPEPETDPPHRARESTRAGSNGFHRGMAILKMQEYRYSLLVGIARFWQLFGIQPTSALRSTSGRW